MVVILVDFSLEIHKKVTPLTTNGMAHSSGFSEAPAGCVHIPDDKTYFVPSQMGSIVTNVTVHAWRQNVHN